MKKLAILIMAFGMSFTVKAQTPQAFAFQSTITHSDGSPFINTNVSLQFNIRSVSQTGTIVYSESHTNVTTSSTGYFTASVGQGTPTSGTFSAIDWNESSYFLELTVDTLSGTGTNYISLGASQLLSVPYALSTRPSIYFRGNSNGVPGVVMVTPDVNRGSGYDIATGDFTVPVSGLYEFTCEGDIMATTEFFLNGSVIGSGGTFRQALELTVGDVFHCESDSTFPMYMNIKEIK